MHAKLEMFALEGFFGGGGAVIRTGAPVLSSALGHPCEGLQCKGSVSADGLHAYTCVVLWPHELQLATPSQLGWYCRWVRSMRPDSVCMGAGLNVCMLNSLVVCLCMFWGWGWEEG